MAARHAVLTGPPGVGKTTLVQKVCEVLKTRNIPVIGFVTQEVRENGRRTGFQIVTLDGVSGTLSSTNSNSKFRVGQYGVELTEFENVALPIFKDVEGMQGGILVIDEVGKMELFSKKFQQEVQHALANNSISILATIPVPKGKPIPFVEGIRNHPKSKLFQIDTSNRNTVLQDILEIITPGHAVASFSK